MIYLFLTAVVWLGYVYVGYLVVVGLISLVRRVRVKARDDFSPTVSVLIAAHNEEKDIAWKVKETFGWDYPADRFEVLIASDASDDRTDEIVQGIKDSRLAFVRMEKRGGKNLALNRLAMLARGEILFFTDANSHVEPHCLRRIVRQFAEERVGCVTGEMHYAQEKTAPSFSSGERLYWGYESLAKFLESKVGSVLVCVGSIFAMRRSLFTPLQPDLANDLEIPLRVAKAGYWVRYEPEAWSTEKVARRPEQEFTRRRRIAGQGMVGMWRLKRSLTGLRGWQFLSRKFLRWLTLLPLAMLLVSSLWLASSPLFTGIFILQALFYGLALVGASLALSGRNGGSLVSVPFYFVLVNVAVLVGVVEACLGRRFSIWEIATLSRGAEETKWQRVN
jgi:cellulose synthase/poly-beta-1,6-N-acetylglucosamine synthase-like glycosyltransferase